VIFNALIIVVLIPLALKGVKYRALGAAALLRRNLLIYGLGGIIVPFVGIKLIDIAQVNGSLVTRDGVVVGSSLISQSFQDPKYFWGRLSATRPCRTMRTASGARISGR
jgi:K+-transporting ATPase c subunit